MKSLFLTLILVILLVSPLANSERKKDIPSTVTYVQKVSQFKERINLKLKGKRKMAFNEKQFREVITQVLKYLDPEIPFSEDAVELLLLTAAVESDFGTYLYQVKGPAQGVFQMEPATTKDIIENFLKYKKPLMKKCDDMLGPVTGGMVYNLGAQVAMARVHYFRVKSRIPAKNDIAAMADYYKKHYNTYLGKSTVEGTISKYKKYVLNASN
jgi:hypothetical protein